MGRRGVGWGCRGSGWGGGGGGFSGGWRRLRDRWVVGWEEGVGWRESSISVGRGGC